MSYYKDPFCENSKKFKLIGSQISLTPRSEKSVLTTCHKSHRPCSAVPCNRTLIEHYTECNRPKSAEYTILNLHSKPLQWPSSSTERGPSLGVSHFTDLSSKLLQNLLENSNNHKVPVVNSKSPEAEGTTSKPQIINVEKYLEIERNNEYFNSNKNLKFQKSEQENSHTCVSKDKNLRNLKASKGFHEIAEEKTVKFSDWNYLDFHSERQIEHQKTCPCYRPKKKNCHSTLEHDYKPFFEETQTYKQWQNESEASSLVDVTDRKSDLEIKSMEEVKDLYSDTEVENSKPVEKNEEEKCIVLWEDFSKKNVDKTSEKTTENLNESLKSPASQSNLKIDNVNKKKDLDEELQKVTQDIRKENQEEKKPDENEQNLKQLAPIVTDDDMKHDCAPQKIDVNDSTYEEIVHLLRTLEEEDSESLNLENNEDESAKVSGMEVLPSEKVDYLNAVSSYLEEMELEDENFDVNYEPAENWSSKNIISPRLEELLNKNSVELAHEVFSLKIQIEDQKKGIKLLRDTLAEMKEAKKNTELEHQEALHKVTSEAEALVQRHQKFIKQLLNEKKNLNETVSKLVEDLKSGEEKYKKNIKAIEEKHLIEIKRAKEAQAVADKIKREKWMENKTKKIKEMTVKGLEPELSRMAARQQEEVTELRNLHKAELEAVELRAARRNAELMDELRAELTKEKERAIAKETATLRAAMEKDFEEERNKFQLHSQSLKERIRKLEERLSNQELEFQQRLIDYKQEEERNKQKIIRIHQENIEEIQRQHLVELRNLKESEEADKQILLSNYKKEQAAKFLERETELHQEYKRERDQEIEMVIDALEKESAKIQSELNTANEGRLKRLKDKMEAEIKELEGSEAALKIKLSETKSKLSEKEDFITELNSEIRQLQTELTYFKKSCEEMSLEKAKLKEIIREEFENHIRDLKKEKENLEKDIISLKELHTKELAKKDQANLQVKYEMQKELTRVCSRIKTAVSKKEKIIESLREENGAANQKCRQLEFLLDQQRRNLLLQMKLRKIHRPVGFKLPSSSTEGDLGDLSKLHSDPIE